ncbi:MAG: hypothetical protein GY853_05820 [PVC group bacterium]|nr:hypothetical protein [PVC group bacterium]
MAQVDICVYPSGYSLDAGELAKYGATHRYTTMASMEAGEDIDWVTATDNPVVDVLGGDGGNNWSGSPDSPVTFAGWTVDSDYYLTIQTIGTARNETTAYSTTYYAIETDADNAIAIDNSSAFYVHVDGIQARTFGGTARSTIYLTDSLGIIELKNCRIKNDCSAGYSRNINWNPTTGGTTRIWNTTFEGGQHSLFVNTGTVYFYHSIITDSDDDAIETQGNSVTVINCAVFNNDDDFQDAFTLVSYCASDDGDGSNAIDISPGTEATDWAAAFTDYSNGDFSVKDTNSVLYNAGDDLSSEFTDLTGDSDPLATDILGNTRTTDDVGAYAYVVSGGTVDLEGIALSNSEITSTVARMRAFPVAMETTSQLTISVQRQRSLISAINTLSDLNAELQAVTFKDLESVIQNASEVTSTLNRLRALRSDINTISEIAGTLLSEGAVELSAGISNTSSLTATLARLRAFFSQIANTSEVNGTVITEAFITLSTVIQNTTELTNEIARLRSLVSTIQNDSDVTGVLNRLRALELSVANVSQVVGNIAEAITKGNFWRITLTQDAMFKTELTQDAKFKTTLTQDAMFGIKLEDK